jgi:ribonuclease III
MHPWEDLKNKALEIESKIGYTFIDKNLLYLAFVHRSFVNENKKILTQHNERLEFLGDSILGSIVAAYLYRKFENLPEGELSSLRASIVECSACSLFFQKLHLQPYLLLGKGEQDEENRGRESIFANAFEALIGAIFLDGGFEAAEKFLLNNFQESFTKIISQPVHNYKAELQVYFQKKLQKNPSYKVIEESGPDHFKSFKVAAMVDSQELGEGSGSSKKEAEQKAAADALQKLEKRDV